MHYLRKVPKSPQGVLKPKSCMGVNAQLCLYHLLHFTEGTEDQKSQDVSLNVLAKLLQVCPTLCDPMNYSPDCSSVQAPLSMGFPRQEYRSALPCLSPGDQPNPGMEPVSLASTALAGRFFLPLHHLGSPRAKSELSENLMCPRHGPSLVPKLESSNFTGGIMSLQRCSQPYP